MRTCIILNPIAGSAKQTDGMQERLEGLKAEALHVSQQPGDAERFAEESSQAGAELIISAGRDGTLNEVVNGIANAGCNSALAVLPLGTGNDFARTLGIPDDFDRAVQQIMDGRIREVDLVRVPVIGYAISLTFPPAALAESLTKS